MTRREMIAGSAIGLGAVCTCPAAAANAAARSTNCATPELEPESLTIGDKQLTIDLAKAASLAEEGSAADVINKEKSIGLVVIHAGKGQYYALSRLCTHAWRTLSYIRTRRVLMCTNANHSIFDLQGQIVKGPAEKPLTSYPVQLKDGKLVIGLQGVQPKQADDSR
jgi:nitrite reductase/ring-hydroxylating ferredoxin subunit